MKGINMRKILLLTRFSLYGLLTFIAFGYMLNNPYLNDSPASLELMLYFGLAGAVSFPLSAGAALALNAIIKELIRNE